MVIYINGISLNILSIITIYIPDFISNRNLIYLNNSIKG